jgi:hypothetical protein
MGGVLSSSAAVATTTENNIPVTQTTEEPKPTVAEPVQQTVAEPVQQTVTETVQQTVTETVQPTVAEPVNTDVKIEETPASVETRKEEVLERYVEPSGTKVEVAPVEVAPTADVVKKGKKKNKKHH